MQVIRDTSFGGSLGSALGQGLQMLAQGKLQQMQQQKIQSQTFQALRSLGAPQHEAMALALTPSDVQKKLLPDYITALSRRQAEQPQEQQIDLSQLLAGLQGQSAAAPAQEASIREPKPEIAEIPKMPTTQQAAKNFTQQMGIGGEEALNQVIQQAAQQKQEEVGRPIAEPIPEVATEAAPTAPTKATKKQPSALGTMTPKEKLELFKYSKKERKEILEGEKAANDSIRTLDRMDELNKKGQLINPIVYKGLTHLGLDIQGLMNADTQEFEKLTTEFLKGMKSIFGARVSNVEMQQFVKGIPSLMQTPAGREAVIRNMRTVAQGAKIKAQAMRDIIKENNDVPPLDLEERISERIDPQMSELSDNFKRGIEMPKAGDRLTSLPPAASFSAGTIITNKKTGQRMRSDGSKWVKA